MRKKPIGVNWSKIRKQRDLLLDFRDWCITVSGWNVLHPDQHPLAVEAEMTRFLAYREVRLQEEHAVNELLDDARALLLKVEETNVPPADILPYLHNVFGEWLSRAGKYKEPMLDGVRSTITHLLGSYPPGEVYTSLAANDWKHFIYKELQNWRRNIEQHRR